MVEEDGSGFIPRGIRIWDRRVEMLRQALQGIRPSAIVRSIQANTDLNVGVSDSTLWDDWTKREEWMPVLLRIREDVAELPISEAFAGLLEARRLAFNLYLRASNDFAKVGALREIRENIKTELTLRQSMGLIPKVADKLQADVQGDLNLILRTWRPDPDKDKDEEDDGGNN